MDDKIKTMYQQAIFKDRLEAGRKLGQKLKELRLKNVVVVAIPSGGVPVGKEVAKVLNSPLDLVVVRKIQFPWTTEAGFGAVAADGTVYLGPAAEEFPQEVIDIQTQKAKQEVKRRAEIFLKGRKKVKLEGKTAVLVDDGLAAGSTMFTAVQSLKKQKPAKIIVAVPTSSGSAVELIKPNVDELISLYIHPQNLPFAVASSYENWYDLSGEEVKDCLGK